MEMISVFYTVDSAICECTAQHTVTGFIECELNEEKKKTMQNGWIEE